MKNSVQILQVLKDREMLEYDHLESIRLKNPYSPDPYHASKIQAAKMETIDQCIYWISSGLNPNWIEDNEKDKREGNFQREEDSDD